MATASMGLLSAIVSKDEPHRPVKSEGDQTINLFSQPERLDQRVALSCSLVDQEHHGTWGRAGLIVEAPTENVIITLPQDVGALVMSKKDLMEQAGRNRLLTADQLLKQTYQSSYNEVVVLANSNGSKIMLVGFFYKVGEDGLPLDQDLAQQMKNHGSRLNLPVIAITQPNEYAEDKILPSEARRSHPPNLIVDFTGKRYFLQVDEKLDFNCWDERGFVYFPSPEEIEGVFNFLKTSGYDPQEVAVLRKRYQDKDVDRQKPKIQYDNQGNIISLEKVQGYGYKGETIYIVAGIYGAAWRMNWLEEYRLRKLSMADPHREVIIEKEKPLLSPDEAESVIQKALLAARDVGERAKLMQFQESVLPIVQEQWDFNLRNRSVRVAKGTQS